MLVGGEPGPWGPTVTGGRRWRLLRRALNVVGVLALVLFVSVATTGFLLVRQAESALSRVSVGQLDVASEPSAARHFLVVGSDARDELDAETRAGVPLGQFEGQRSDTIIYVAISADRSEISFVSFPRDLLVMDDGRRWKLTETYAGGPDRLVRVLRENFGLPVNHYVQISIGGFLDVVRTLGGVHLCLDEPLRDRKSGADFDAGCHDMNAEEALAYVRSRQGARADFERIERQQRFLRAVLSELTEAGVLTNVPRLFDLVDDVAGSVVTDDRLRVTQMRGLAGELREVVRDGMPMTTLPGYTRIINGRDFVIAYGPGARAIVEKIRAGEPLPDRGTPEERSDTRVALWSGGRAEAAQIVNDTLLYAGFAAGGAGSGPSDLQAGETTTIYRLPGKEAKARWVAATLGAPVRPLPSGVSVPDNADVIVAVGDDATS